LDYHQKSRQQLVIKPTLLPKALVTVGGLAIIFIFFNYAVVPVARAGANIKLAMQSIGYIHEYLEKSARDDKLDPTPLNLNGRFYVQEYSTSGKRQSRNNADFKNYEKLSQVYNLLGDNQKAYDWGIEAAKRYPGIGRLQFNLAEIAESMGKTSLAVEHYKEAVFIEEKYRDQFRQMYPDRKMVSRLGEEKYIRAKQKTDSLSRQSAI